MLLKYLQNHRGFNCVQGVSFKKIHNISVASPPASVGKAAISSHIYSTKIPAVLIPFLRNHIFSALSLMYLLPKERFISELRRH